MQLCMIIHMCMLYSSSMDLELNPSNLNLTSKLIQVTSAGATPTEDVLDSQILWQYTIPSVNRNEFIYEGTTMDTTPTLFNPLQYSNTSDCHVRQLSGRRYGNAAFEVEVTLSEPQGIPNLSYQIGSYEGGSDVIPATEILGERIVVPHPLLPAQEIFITMEATNPNSVSTVAQCSLRVYDRSPPLGRVDPIERFTSNPNKFVVLLSLFDEFGLEDTQHVAVGTVAGEEGTDIMDWQSIQHFTG